MILKPTATGTRRGTFNSLARMRVFKRISRQLLISLRRFIEDDGPRLAAAMAYYAALSFFPLLIVLVAGLSAVLAGTAVGQDAQQRLLAVVQERTSADLSHQIEGALASVNEHALSRGPIGFLFLLATAIAIFIQFEAAFDQIWSMPANPRHNWKAWLSASLTARMKALAILISLGAFVIAVVIASVFWTAVQTALTLPQADGSVLRWIFGLPTNMGINWLAFTLIYRFVPKADVRWSAAAEGAIVAAILWEAGRQLLTVYLTHAGYLSAYGIIGSFLAIMLWTYYAMMVVFYGAEYVRFSGETADWAPRNR
jgi:membrane protein